MLRARFLFHLAPFVILLLALGLYAVLLLAPAESGASGSGASAAPLMAAGALVAFVAAVYVCYKLEQSLVEPMRALIRAARKIGSGSLDVTVPVMAESEVGELSAAFNRMAMQLRERRRDGARAAWRRQCTLENALASLPDPIFVLNRAGDIEFENPAATQLVPEHGALPAPLDDSVHRLLQDGPDVLAQVGDETVQMRLGGELKRFLPRFALLQDDHGPVGVVVVLRDLTQLSLLDELRTDLLATVCHEFNTPLTGIRMSIHLLLEPRTGPLTYQQRELLVTARDEIERLLRKVDDLTNIAKLSTARLATTNVPPLENAGCRMHDFHGSDCNLR